MKYNAIVQGQNLEIELNRREHGIIEAEIGGRVYRLEGKAVEPGIYWFNWNNQSLEIGVTRSLDGYVVSLGGRRIPVEILDARTPLRRAAEQGQDGVVHLRAPMPGKVVRVLASEGAEVEANQGIIILEAMKMQNEVKAPKKGLLSKLGVKEGQAINSGDLIATLE